MMYEVVQKPKRATKNNSSKSKQKSSILRKKKKIRIKKIFKIKKNKIEKIFFKTFLNHKNIFKKVGKTSSNLKFSFKTEKNIFQKGESFSFIGSLFLKQIEGK